MNFILGLGAVICVVVGLVLLLVTDSKYDRSGEKRIVVSYRRWAIIPGMILLIIFIIGSVATVPAGHRGVLLRFGKVSGVLSEGLNGKLFLVDSVTDMSVQTQLFTVEATAASRDLQDVATTIGLNYRIIPDQVGEIYRTVGVDYIERIAHPAIQEIVKEITARYNAEDMILRRSEVKADITAALVEKLRERDIITENVNITDFDFSEEFTNAIESKVVAVQRVMEAENKLRQIEVEARQAEQRAKGEAAALIANAEGQARSIAIVTDAQTRANNSIASSLSPEVLQYIMLDRIGSDVRVIVVPSGQGLTLGTIQP